MKRFLLLFALVSFLCSCNKEHPLSEYNVDDLEWSLMTADTTMWYYIPNAVAADIYDPTGFAMRVTFLQEDSIGWEHIYFEPDSALITFYDKDMNFLHVTSTYESKSCEVIDFWDLRIDGEIFSGRVNYDLYLRYPNGAELEGTGQFVSFSREKACECRDLRDETICGFTNCRWSTDVNQSCSTAKPVLFDCN